MLFEGSFNIWPMDKLLDVRLLRVFNSLTVVLYLFAIFQRLSPDLTVYVFSLVLFVLGSLSTWPIDKLLDVKLFKDFKSLTVVLYLFAILHKLSPDTIFM